MTATIVAFGTQRAQLQRALQPMIAPRLAAALVTVALDWAFLPLTIGCAAIAGYAEIHNELLNGRERQ